MKTRWASARITRPALGIGVLALVTLMLAPPVAAQKIKGGKLTGTLVSESGFLPNLSQAFVFTTPSSGFFILTQACGERPDAMRLQSNALGSIPTDPSTTCTDYTPGIVLPQSDNINCFDQLGVGGYNCVITGVLTPK